MADSARRWARGVAISAIVVALVAGPAARVAHAADNAISGAVGGVGDILQGALAIPMGALAGTFSGPPIIGTVGGLASGAVQAVGMTARGIFRLIGAAIPAAAAAPYLPFVL